MEEEEVAQLVCGAEVEEGDVGRYVGVVYDHSDDGHGGHQGDEAAEGARFGVVGHRFEKSEHICREGQQNGDADGHGQSDGLAEVDGVEDADDFGHMDVGGADDAEAEEYPPGRYDAEDGGADGAQVHDLHLGAAEDEKRDVDDEGILRGRGDRQEEEEQEDAADAARVAVAAV